MTYNARADARPDKTCYRCGERFRSGTGNKGDLCGKCVREGFRPGDEDSPF